MGSKFSFCSYVIYCGFPQQRRRFKEKEEKMQRDTEAKWAAEAFERAQKFKADYPEYCRMAGIKTACKEWCSVPAMSGSLEKTHGDK